MYKGKFALSSENHFMLNYQLHDTLLYYLGRLRNKLVQCLPTPCACPTVLWCIAAEMKSVWMINWKTRCVVATPLQQVSTPEHNRHGTAQNHNTKSFSSVLNKITEFYILHTTYYIRHWTDGA